MIQKIKSTISSIKYVLFFLKVLNSPFLSLKLIWYWGNIEKGNPYFFPRKWVRDKKDKKYLKPVRIKYLGIDYNGLGWKEKYGEFRFEYAPSFSFVILGKQLHITIVPKVEKTDFCLAQDCYWEAFLYWELRTNKELHIENRLIEIFKQYSATWTNSKTGETDYYLKILKPKYVELYNFWKKHNKDDK